MANWRDPLGAVGGPVSGTTVTATSKFLAADGAAGTPSYTFTNETSTGLFRAGAFSVVFGTVPGANNSTVEISAGPAQGGNTHTVNLKAAAAGGVGTIGFYTSGSQRWSVSSTGALLGQTATSTLGWNAASGAGGTIAQATSKATGVTLNTICGTITLNGAALAADTTVSFVLTDSVIAANDLVHIIHDSVGTLGAYTFAVTPAAGTATIAVHNCTPGSLSEAIVLRFFILKGTVN